MPDFDIDNMCRGILQLVRDGQAAGVTLDIGIPEPVFFKVCDALRVRVGPDRRSGSPCAYIGPSHYTAKLSLSRTPYEYRYEKDR